MILPSWAPTTLPCLVRRELMLETGTLADSAEDVKINSPHNNNMAYQKLIAVEQALKLETYLLDLYNME